MLDTENQLADDLSARAATPLIIRYELGLANRHVDEDGQRGDSA
jgi:hypothetical protein